MLLPTTERLWRDTGVAGQGGDRGVPGVGKQGGGVGAGFGSVGERRVAKLVQRPRPAGIGDGGPLQQLGGAAVRQPRAPSGPAACECGLSRKVADKISGARQGRRRCGWVVCWWTEPTLVGAAGSRPDGEAAVLPGPGVTSPPWAWATQRTMDRPSSAPRTVRVRLLGWSRSRVESVSGVEEHWNEK